MKFQTEKPIINFEADKFLYKDLSKNILDNFLLEMTLPNCFGLYGNWGSGKSSLISFIIKHTNDDHKNYRGIKTVYFEPWKYEYSEQKDLVFALLNCIEKALNVKNNKKWKQIKRDLLVIGAGLVRKLVNIDIQSTREDFELMQKEIFNDYENWIDKIEYLKIIFNTTIQDILKKSKISKLLIFIDDLDRCLPENTVKLLEGIKNFLSVDNTLFILAIDKRVVTEMIEKKYGLHSGYGDEYIMKIIHYYYDLPKIKLKEIVKEILNTHNIQAEEQQHKYISQFLEKFAGEPRIAKYILHQFCMKIIISPQAREILANDSDKTMLLHLFVASYLLSKFSKLFLNANATQHLENLRKSTAAILNRSHAAEYQYENIIKEDPVIESSDRKKIEEILKMPIITGRESSPPNIIDTSKLNGALLALQNV